MIKVIKVKDLKEEELPEVLRSGYYFDFEANPFMHQALFERDDVTSVVEAIAKIGDYAKGWLKNNIDLKLKENNESISQWQSADYPEVKSVGDFEVFVEEGAVFEPRAIIGTTGGSRRLYVASGTSAIANDFYLQDGDIFIGEDNVIEPGVGIKGAAIIGNNNVIRQGAYFRGDVIIGNKGVYRGEVKNTVMMDKTNFPHPCYIGDSICGYNTHFGNQVTAANLGIFAGIKDSDKQKNLVFKIDHKRYDIGRRKMGVVLGDFSQIGCSSVADPGTFLAPYTIAYPLTRIGKGFYGPYEILKNKPMEHGVIERVSMRDEA